MTQRDQDLYGISNDGRGWRTVSEDDFWKFVELVDPPKLDEKNGLSHFQTNYGGMTVEGCSVKCPADRLPHIADGALREFIRSQREVQASA